MIPRPVGGRKAIPAWSGASLNIAAVLDWNKALCRGSTRVYAGQGARNPRRPGQELHHNDVTRVYRR
jgi:hypothetical protein